MDSLLKTSLRDIKNEIQQPEFDSRTLFEKTKTLETLLAIELILFSQKSCKRSIRSHRCSDSDTTTHLQVQHVFNCVLVEHESDIEKTLNANMSALFETTLHAVKTIKKKDKIYRIPLTFDLSNIESLNCIVAFKRSCSTNFLFTNKKMILHSTPRALGADLVSRIANACRNSGCAEETVFELSQTGFNALVLLNRKKDEKDDIQQTNWDFIFDKLGVCPTDCACGAYSKALYERAIQNKGLRGIKPNHDETCDRKLKRIEC